MNIREAYVALVAGKKVRDRHGDVWSMDEDGRFLQYGGYVCAPTKFDHGPFEIFEEPATDEELAGEMEACANDPAIPRNEQSVYLHCAKMVRTRRVGP